MSVRSSPLSGVSIAYVESLYERFRTEPDQLDQSWRCLFGVLDAIGHANGIDVQAELSARGAPPDTTFDVVDLLRSRGHLIARLDPLAIGAGDGLDTLRAHAPPPPRSRDDLADIYAGSLAVETAHIDDAVCRNWLIERREAARPPMTRADLEEMLHDLIRADEFERFLGRKFPTKKRFGAEGADAIVPLLRAVLRRAAAAGVTDIVLGTMHRGRLNIAANVLDRSLEQLLAEIKGAHPFPNDEARPGDVPYHLGHQGRVDTGAGTISVTLLANPSHLEAIDPVVLGRARAQQDAAGHDGTRRVLPVILHTDAAVIGQGVVAETLQLAGVPGFATGGTVHIVVDNQIGFTTEIAEARTSTHCTGAWKAVDSCILHVNGDDPVAVVQAAELAVDWRQEWARDAVVDLVCYRRNGHNEIDEPTFTQPVVYARIARQVPVADAATRRLVADGIVSEASVAAFAESYRARLGAAYEASGTFRPNGSGYLPHDVRRAPEGSPTGIDRSRLDALAATLAEPPDGSTLHPKMDRLLRQRRLADGVNWAVAEALAFGSLLQDGRNVRLTGQDVVRGAFSHRHYSLVDTLTGERHTALSSVAGNGASFAVHNSPLSEYAVLGFEYGYSLGAPNALTVWEAQFGDFANGAQIVIDQFIAAGEEKWCAPSGLVLLLPHGLEGQGPEHSSARLERFLQMAAGGNMRIANPSTPASYFHLLRRQALVADRKPLVVMGAKRLLRLPAAQSPAEAFEPGTRFAPVLADPSPGTTRLLLCTGKIAYDLLAERDRIGAAADVGIVRLEEIYPFPADELRDIFRRCPEASCTWVQEEPCNMGAWTWLDRRVEHLRRDLGLASPTMSYVGRPESGSPAGSFHGDHDDDQARIVAEAFAPAA